MTRPTLSGERVLMNFFIQVLAQELQIGGANQCAIRKDGEDYILHLSHGLQDVLPHHRLASRQEREVDAHIGGFGEYLFPLFWREKTLPQPLPVGESLLCLHYTITPCVTALAMQVTGG